MYVTSIGVRNVVKGWSRMARPNFNRWCSEKVRSLRLFLISWTIWVWICFSTL